MGKLTNHSIYLKKLEAALAMLKESLLTNEETALNALENAKITDKASKQLKQEKQNYCDKTADYYRTVASLADLSNEFSQRVNKATAMSTVVSADEAAVNQNMMLAAKSIEAAMQSVSVIASDAAAINAKASSEDNSTRISSIASEAYKKGIEATEKAEEATMSSLNSTILAAKSNASSINSLIDNLSKNVTSFNDAIAAAIKTAKANIDAAEKDYADTLSACTVAEIALEKATVDYNSAKEASENTIKPGRTLKTVKDDKTGSTKK